MQITDNEKQIVERAEDELITAGTQDIARLWIQRGVGLIVSGEGSKIEELEEAEKFIQACLVDARG